MRISKTALPGVLRVEPRIFVDDRGRFFDAFHGPRYATAGIDATFVQDSVSHSQGNILRGLHFQEPNGQGKLVQVLTGAVYDVVVDVRRGSPTFGTWLAFELTAEHADQLFIPSGFAHGFLVLTESADIYYKLTEIYKPEAERTIAWNDPSLAIPWPSRTPLVSDRDGRAPKLADAPLLPVF